MDSDGARALATAIIKQGCIDLWNSAAPKKYSNKGMSQKEFDRHVRAAESKRRVLANECREFFDSTWFDTLKEGDIDGRALVRQIEWMRRNNQKIHIEDV